MRCIKDVFFITVLIFFTGCTGDKSAEQMENGGTAQVPKLLIKKDTSKSSVEDKIMDAVMALPEVEAANAHIDSFSNHQHGIASMVDLPGEGQTDYGVRVGYNGDERFEVYYFFEVNPVSLQIKIMDIDSFIPIEDWRKKKENK